MKKKKGSSASSPWSDTYWPSFQGGISSRWQMSNPEPFSYTLMTQEELQGASQDDIAKLSPAEKLDILNGRYDYPTVNSEWQRTSPDDPQWEGICHGWAPASLHYLQPNPTTVVNAQNITIPFGSSDIKALLSYFVAEFSDPQSATKFVGQRCNIDLQQNPAARSTPACADLNAGAFHVLLANVIGGAKKGFVVDRDRSIMVWNQPVFKYSATITGGNSVALHYCYGKETQPMWEAHPTNVVCEDLAYSLDLSSAGKITGGSYSTYDRPDFLWQTSPVAFYGYFSAVGSLYAQSTNTTSHNLMMSSAQVERVGQSAAVVVAGAPFGVAAGRYPAGFRRSWRIPGGGQASILRLEASTTRFGAFVRVFEGENGQGPLLATFHGDVGERMIKIREGAGALITVSTDKSVNDAKVSLVAVQV
jgi:hypothetical protein